MANREALKELQTRLAARLQAAKAEGVAVASWLSTWLERSNAVSVASVSVSVSSYVPFSCTPKCVTSL